MATKVFFYTLRPYDELEMCIRDRPGDDLIATRRARAGNQRRKHAVLFPAFHRALHGFIIQNLKWMILEREQLPAGNLLHLLSPVSYTHLSK